MKAIALIAIVWIAVKALESFPGSSALIEPVATAFGVFCAVGLIGQKVGVRIGEALKVALKLEQPAEYKISTAIALPVLTAIALFVFARDVQLGGAISASIIQLIRDSGINWIFLVIFICLIRSIERHLSSNSSFYNPVAVAAVHLITYYMITSPSQEVDISEAYATLLYASAAIATFSTILDYRMRVDHQGRYKAIYFYGTVQLAVVTFYLIKFVIPILGIFLVSLIGSF